MSPAATSPGLGEFSGGDRMCMHVEKWQNSFKMVIINEKSLIYNVMMLNVKISHRQPFFTLRTTQSFLNFRQRCHFVTVTNVEFRSALADRGRRC